VLSGLLAGAASLAIAQSAFAVTNVDVLDDRKVLDTGFDIIYEARDLDLPQATRDGFTQARSSLDATKARVKDYEADFDSKLPVLVSKAYWTQARELIRLKIGTMRFDLNTLVASSADKKTAKAVKDDFIKKIETLDLAIRAKSPEKAAAALTAAQSALDTVVTTLV